jgi:EmrB/QacA subfamily drug resistance transporter
VTSQRSPDAAGRHEPSAESIGVAELISRQHAESDAGDRRGGTPSGPEPHKWWTLVAVCLGTFMLLLDITIVNVALPDIQQALNSSFADLQWVVDAYALTLAALLLTAGSLADMFGRRLMYIIGVSVFTIASALCGAAQNTLMLQLSRALQGVGGAIMFSVSLALLADAFRGRDRGVAFGIWGAITGLAVAIGPLLGGILTSGLSWRWIFFVNLPFGVVAIVLTVLRVAESKERNARRPDIVGFVLFTAGLASLVYGLIESNQRSWTDPVVLGTLIGAGVLLIAFVLAEMRVHSPMFDLSLFRKPTFTGGLVTAFGISASIFSLFLYLVLYLQDVLRYSALQTGVRMLVVSAGIIVTSGVAGRLTSRVPIRFLIAPGLLLIGVGLLLMRGLTASSTWTDLIAGLAIGGAGVGLVNPPLASTAIGVVPPQKAGMASGINSTFRQVGIATGIALLGTLFASRVTSAVVSGAAQVPALQGHGNQLAAAIKNGSIGSMLEQAPPQAREPIEQLARSAFTTGLNLIMLVAAIIALVACVVAFFTIRQRDFVHQEQPGAAG